MVDRRACRTGPGGQLVKGKGICQRCGNEARFKALVMAMDGMRFMAQQNVMADGKAFMVKGRGRRHSQQVGQGQARHAVSRR